MMNNLSGNITESLENDYRLTLKKVADVFAVAILILIMFTMGADIKFKEVLNHLKLPISIMIGMCSQFLIMPLIGFTLIQIFQLSGPSVLGILLISCCPGGSLSNIITYWIDGDIPLSVTMTTVSTALALGFMPFNYWLYGHWVNVGELNIPYVDMVISVAYVSIPAAFGILLRWKFPKIATYVTKIGTIIAMIMIVICVILYNLTYPDLLKNSHWKYCLAVIIMPLAGFTFGYGLAYFSRRSIAACKTIGVESGIQNVSIAFGVLAISSFSFQEQKSISLFPMLYGITMNGLGILAGIVYKIHVYIGKLCSEEKNKSKSSTQELKNATVKKSYVTEEVF